MAKNKTEIHVTTVFDGELDATDVFVSLIAQKYSQRNDENVNSKCEKNIKKYNQASRANSSRHSANTISAVFQPNISRG